jgi:hypothetical protein
MKEHEDEDGLFVERLCNWLTERDANTMENVA